MGQVCVVRDNEGNKELVEDGVTGFLFHTREEFVEIYHKIVRGDDNGV